MKLILPAVLWVLLAGLAPAQQCYPGNGSDCEIRVSVNGVSSPSTNGKHVVSNNDIVTLRFVSPSGSLVGEGFLGTVQLIPSGSLSAIFVPGVGNVWLDPSPSTPSAIIFNGLPGTSNPLPSILNSRVDFIVPPAIFGFSLSLYASLIVNDTTNPGGAAPFGVADAQELVLQ